jgi:hypothetical protein
MECLHKFTNKNNFQHSVKFSKVWNLTIQTGMREYIGVEQLGTIEKIQLIFVRYRLGTSIPLFILFTKFTKNVLKNLLNCRHNPAPR